MRKPDFQIVGAPKCGTTALYEYLAQHPDVFVPHAKELHFFGTDLVLPGMEISEQDYLNLFTGAGNQQRIGHASGWYLFSTEAANEISQFNPAIKIIIMLRNPLEMIYSLHSQRLYSGTEHLEDFQQAIEAEADRRTGVRPPNYSWIRRGLFYLEVAKYSEQVKRYLDIFGWDKTKVIIFEDFQKNPREIYREVCEFLTVGTGFEPSFKFVNANKRARSKLVRDLLDRQPPAIVQQVGRMILSSGQRRKLYQTLKQLNSDERPRPPMDPDLRRCLQAHFLADVERLSDLLGRDLTHWCKEELPSPDYA